MSPKRQTTSDSNKTVGNSETFADAPPYNLTSDVVLQRLKVDPMWGLSDDLARNLLSLNGPNILQPPKKISPLRIFVTHLSNAMTIVLIGAMAVSFGTLDWVSGGVIGVLVILNVAVGFSQEYKAEKTLAALESVGSPTATVVRHSPADKSSAREGRVRTIPTEELVVGDIVMIKIGDVVPADARVLDGHVSNLDVDEALLTGESLPVSKDAAVLSARDIPVGDRANMLYAGAQVTKGRARAVVVQTGMTTELGKIASALEKKETAQGSALQRFWVRTKVLLGLAGTTPLQIKLNKLAYTLLLAACVLAIIVVSSTGYKNIPNSIATYAVAAAVSILPASLVAVTTLTLAVACRSLAARNALVRRMDAVETIGGVTDICSDKTGTITVGRMVLRKAWIPPSASAQGTGEMYSVETGSDPYYPRGTIRRVAVEDRHAEKHSPENDEKRAAQKIMQRSDSTGSNDDDDDDDDLTAEDIIRVGELEARFEDLVTSAALNNMASIHRGDKSKEDGWEASGDPTEIALQVFAHKAGLGKPHLTHKRKQQDNALHRITSTRSHQSAAHQQSVSGHYKILVEHPFDSTIKRMSTVWTYVADDKANDNVAQNPAIVYMKGAVERVLDRCTHVGLGDARTELTPQLKDDILARMDALAGEGLRVLCLAGRRVTPEESKTISSAPRDELERDCGVLGLVGIYDPPRPESRGAVMDALRAGIIPRMLTGDHAATAAAIARSVGILNDTHGESACMTGQQFDAKSEAEIDALPELPVVVARCAPETKVRMVEALHRRGRKVVMTGDGVNDAPSLKRADVGVAMGLNGSDVAKGVAEIVLADDNFSTIVRAIRKGRSVFNNLAKFLIYLLSGNIAEVLVLMVGLAFRTDGVAIYPLSPVAAMWINTITAGPPALALGLEGTDPKAMDQPPSEFQTIFTATWFIDTFFYGIVIGSQTIINYVIILYGHADGEQDLEPYCNDPLVGLQPGCEETFRARGTAFATLKILLMVHALTCKHVTRSIFHMNLGDNRLLLWIVSCLSLTVFPLIYIPVINENAFQHTGLTWEWGIIFGQIILYFAVVELYKLIRRKLLRRSNSGGRKGGSGLEVQMAPTMEPSADAATRV